MRSRMASWSCSGMPNSMPMVRMGIWAPRSAMKSKPPFSTSGSRLRAAEFPDLGLEVIEIAGCEHAGEQAAMDVVGGGVLEDDRSRRNLHSTLDELEHRPLAGDVGLPVLGATLDVLEAAQRRRTRIAGCNRAAARHAASSRPDTDPNRCRSRTGRSRDRIPSWSSQSPSGPNHFATFHGSRLHESRLHESRLHESRLYESRLYQSRPHESWPAAAVEQNQHCTEQRRTFSTR